MKALIAAGGKGSRLRPLTYAQNKHTIPLANRPLIIQAVEKIVEAGIDDIAISVNEGETELQKLVGDGSTWNVTITYLEQKGGALGVADVIRNATSFLGGEDFVFYLGDNVLCTDIGPFIEEFYEKKLNCLLALTKVQEPERFGVPVIENDRVVRVEEKPENPPSDYAVVGLYVYDKHMVEAVKHLELSERGEYEISDAHTWLLENGFEVGFREITGWWKDTGKPEDLLEGNQLLLKEMESSLNGELRDSSRIQGQVVLEEGAVLEGNTFVRGPVVIGKNVRIKDAYIGPFTSIGDDVVVEGAEVEHSIVMSGTEILVSQRIVDSILGHNMKLNPYKNTLPRGHKLIVGDNSHIEI